MNRQEVHAAVDGFAERFVADWAVWLHVQPDRRPVLFGEILRRWQAVRPRTMRRTRIDGRHDAPFLEDLLDDADRRVRRLGDLSVGAGWKPTADQESALIGLWATFVDLAIEGPATCVGISKSVLLVTNGRIGPALDSNVQLALRIRPPQTARDWISVLSDVADDIAEFERGNAQLSACVRKDIAGSHRVASTTWPLALNNGPRRTVFQASASPHAVFSCAPRLDGKAQEPSGRLRLADGVGDCSDVDLCRLR